MIDNQGSPDYVVIQSTKIPLTTTDVWDVTIDGVKLHTATRNLIEVLDSLRPSHGIYVDTSISNYVYFLRNTSSDDHVIEITYTGNVEVEYPFDNLLGTNDALVSNNCRTYSIALGGFNAATTWVYPLELEVSTFEDGDITRTHYDGNTYVVEVDGIKYTDPRPFTDERASYGSLFYVLQHNNLMDIIGHRTQMPLNGNYQNHQLFNKDTVPHTVKVYLNTSKPYGNGNTVAGPMSEVYRGKAIYCSDDSYNTSPTFGSVNNRTVDSNGFSMTLAKMPLPGILTNHMAPDEIDTRVETVISLYGDAQTLSTDYSGDIPELTTIIQIGNDVYTPNVSESNGAYYWDLDVPSTAFINADFYSVITSRLGGTVAHNYRAVHYSTDIIKQFTKYDKEGQTTELTSKVVLNDWFAIPNTYTPEQIAAMKYTAGTRSGSSTRTADISILGEELQLRTFTSAWMVNNFDAPNGSVNRMLKAVGEVGIFFNQSTSEWSIDLVSAAENPLPTPFYSSNMYDYAYVAVTGLGSAVFEKSMFSATGAGECYYIEDTDTNLWILRL